MKKTDGTYLFKDIYNKLYLPKYLVEDIKKANVLLIPYEGFRDRIDYLFLEETDMLL